MTAIPFSAIRSALKDRASATGLFATVLMHEPKSAPTTDTRSTQAILAIWVRKFGPYPKMSGLSSTALQLTVQARIYRTAMAEPLDEIDNDLMSAASVYMEAITGAFTLGGQVMCVDLDGQTGAAMSSDIGYVTMDNMVFRVADVIIPMILSQEWSQVP